MASFARDPVSIGRVVDEIWPDGEHLVCLGAGGSAVALGRHLLARTVPPATLVFTDRSRAAGHHLQAVLGSWADSRLPNEVDTADRFAALAAPLIAQ